MTEITQGMDHDDWTRAWLAAAREKGHTLRTWGDDGHVDIFVTDAGFHNGPGCETCGWSACMHCDWQAKKIPQCSAVARHDGGPASDRRG